MGLESYFKPQTAPPGIETAVIAIIRRGRCGPVFIARIRQQPLGDMCARRRGVLVGAGIASHTDIAFDLMPGVLKNDIGWAESG